MCIGTVGLVLTGAFVVTARSNTAVQNSQEHTVAEQLVTSQLEQLRTALGNATSTTTQDHDPSNTNWTSTQLFCMQADGSLAATTLANPTDACKTSNNTGATFHQSIASDGTGLYHVNITWNQINGGTGNEDMYYRVYKSNDLSNVLGP